MFILCADDSATPYIAFMVCRLFHAQTLKMGPCVQILTDQFYIRDSWYLINSLIFSKNIFSSGYPSFEQWSILCSPTKQIPNPQYWDRSIWSTSTQKPAQFEIFFSLYIRFNKIKIFIFVHKRLLQKENWHGRFHSSTSEPISISPYSHMDMYGISEWN